MSKWMIYGANGYTGELIARQAKQNGMSPMLAGRNQQQIQALATELDLPFQIFDLEADDIVEQLSAVSVVLHCAGPFSKTALPMMNACLASQTHYLDITGEIDVFEQAQQLSGLAKKAGIVICPGVGFDVIPTDCVAAQLKQKMPDAKYLRLGFDSRGGFSQGTAKTSIEGLPNGGKIRKNGVISSVPLGKITKMIDFGNGEKLGVSIPWGDVSTAYYSTGIPNIEAYIPMTPKAVKKYQKLNYLRWLLKTRPAQYLLKHKINSGPKGPNQDQRSRSPMYVWGEVENDKGNKISCRIQTPNGYDVTVHGSLLCVNHLLHANSVSGTLTPAQLMDPDLIREIQGCSDFVFSQG